MTRVQPFRPNTDQNEIALSASSTSKATQTKYYNQAQLLAFTAMLLKFLYERLSFLEQVD